MYASRSVLGPIERAQSRWGREMKNYQFRALFQVDRASMELRVN